jgi:hypothetical protein
MRSSTFAHIAAVAGQSAHPERPGAAAQPAGGAADENSDDDLGVLDQLRLPPVVFQGTWHSADVIACHVARLHMPPAHATLRTETIDAVCREFPVTGVILRRRKPSAIKRRVGGKSFGKRDSNGEPNAYEKAAALIASRTVDELAVYKAHAQSG